MPVTRSKSIRSVCALIIMTALAGCMTVGDDTAEVSTSICELNAFGEAQDGKKVRLLAVYVSDLHHGTVLKDRSCPDVWLPLADQQSRADDASVKELEDAALGDVINDLSLRRFSVDISGVYRAKGAEGRGALSITKVWSYRRIRGDWHVAQ